MKQIKNITKRFAAFTLIELLVVISIIAILASLALPAVTGALVKGQIAQTVSNYRQLFVLTQSASLDNQTAGGAGAFPGDLSGTNSGVSGWSNTLVPAYCSAVTFNSMGSVKGQATNTTVWLIKSSEDPATLFLSSAGISGSGGSGTLTFASTGPYGAKGGAFVTLGGSAVSITGSNSPTLTNGSALISSNGQAAF
jgi:prepilin-type N-terminal cleavage/methylation domain-containing protein